MGNRWFRAEKYKSPMPRTAMGDGSFVEVAPVDRFMGHRDVLRIRRDWPDGRTEEHYILPPRTRHGETKYLQSGFVAQQSQIEHTEGAIPTVRSISPVPGNHPRDNYDFGTGKRFLTREECNRYYRENKLEKLTQTDLRNMPDGTPEHAGKLSGRNQFGHFDPNGQPARPAGFEGARLIPSGSSD